MVCETHVLVDLRGFIFCIHCGCYTASGRGVRAFVRKLADPCVSRPTKSGQGLLNRLLAGLPPKNGMIFPRDGDEEDEEMPDLPEEVGPAPAPLLGPEIAGAQRPRRRRTEQQGLEAAATVEHGGLV